MAAYVIVGIEWHDDAALAAYGADVERIIEAHGGRYLVSTTDVDVREGEWRPQRAVVLEFPSLEAARAWYESRECAPLLDVRRTG